jgi:hypothetical protein
MNATAPAPVVHTSRSGLVTITMKFHNANRMWSIVAERDGQTVANKFAMTEDDAKAIANEFWRTDGVQASDLVALAAEFETPAPAHQNWFDVSGQPTTRTPAPGTLSPKQRTFIANLASEREVPAQHTAAVAAAAEGTLAHKDASPLIEALLALPKTSTTATTGTSLPDVPAGHYATPSRTGNNDLDFWRVDRPTDGRWAGKTFVKRVIGGHEDQRVSFGETRQALEAILAAGLEEASRAYGQAIGRCGRCNRHLTDETSRAYGIGPDCRSKGW